MYKNCFNKFDRPGGREASRHKSHPEHMYMHNIRYRAHHAPHGHGAITFEPSAVLF